MARGGKRVGRSATAYKQRTDLQAVSKLPVRTASTVYGEGETLKRAQEALPLTTQPTQPQSAGPTPPGPAGPAGSGGTPTGVTAGGTPGASPQVLPGSLPSLTGPSQRPDEPLTAGMPTGPGPGPNVLSQPLPEDPLITGLAALNHLGDGGLPELKALRDVLGAHAANQAAP